MQTRYELQQENKNRPVVLVHGYGDSHRMPWWDRFETRLVELAGFQEENIEVVDLGDIPGTTIDSPKDYANHVGQTVEFLYAKTRHPVTIIAHSMGGINTRWYVEMQDGHEVVEKIVTLGTPHRGTYSAYIGYFSEGGQHMTPNGNPMERLNETGLAEGVEYVSIWSETDPIVWPQEKAKLPKNEHDNTCNVKLERYGHVELIARRHCFTKMLPYL